MRNLLVTGRRGRTRKRKKVSEPDANEETEESCGRTELEVSLGEGSNGGDVDLVLSWKKEAKERRLWSARAREEGMERRKEMSTHQLG